MEAALKTYFEKCQLIFNEHNSNAANLVVFPGTSTHPINHRQLFEKAIKDAEDTEEFEAFVIALQTGPLSSDIERLANTTTLLFQRPSSRLIVRFRWAK